MTINSRQQANNKKIRSPMNGKYEKNAALNDTQRRVLIGVMCTASVDVLSPTERAELLLQLQTCDDWEPGNDPYVEHDFGTLIIEKQRYFFKVDYYDNELAAHSPNPADPAVMRRAIMMRGRTSIRLRLSQKQVLDFHPATIYMPRV